jgi:GNAT superfamily N-acetyltransferase
MIFKIPLVTNTSIPNFIIRKAEVRDTALVFDFIKQLAVYEKMIEDVVATEEILKESLFGETPFAQVVIGEFNGNPVGFALFFTNFSTFLGRPGIFLEDLFVLPEHRGKGYGRTLLAFLAKLAVDNKFGRVEWSVLNWNEPAINVYKGIGAKPMDEWTVFRLSGNKMIEVSLKI